MLARLEDLKNALNITNNTSDAVLFEALRDADAEIKMRCNRAFEITADDITELKNGNGGKTINLRETPIVEITSIHDDVDRVYGPDSLLVEGEDFVCDYKSGIVYMDGGKFSKGFQNIKVVYRGGYGNDIAGGETPIPNDLRQSVIELASGTFLRSQGRINAVTGEILNFNENANKAYSLSDKYVYYDND